ncbi:MAG: hypothetical protein OXB88_11410 [Bacteriovoracales bacterium]|nr:hypothetical protein [Bacteriovoracales bacterium]
MDGKDRSESQTLELDTKRWDFIPNRDKGFVLCCDQSSDDGDIFQIHGRLAQIVTDLLAGKDISPPNREDGPEGYDVHDLPFFKHSKKSSPDLSHKEITAVDLSPLQENNLRAQAFLSSGTPNTDFPAPKHYPYFAT